MVDSVKPKSPADSAVEQKVSEQKSSNSQKANFDSLRSKSVVESVVRNPDVVVNVDRGRNTARVARTLKDLNDAVAHSSLALDALGRIKGEEKESAQLAQGVDELKNNIAGVLDSLRKRVDKAEIISENLSAASVRLEDLDAAQQQASAVELKMKFEDKAAVDVHSGLSRERVMQLLSD